MTTKVGEGQNPEITPEILEEKTNFLMKHGTLLGIVMTLRMYKSLSAPEISDIMGIKKTTMFNYLNQLEEEKFIEMDDERSHEEWLELGARARKYYRSTLLSEMVFNMYSQGVDSYEEIHAEMEHLPELLSTPDGSEGRIVQLIQGLAQDKMDLGSFVNMVSLMNNAIMNVTYSELSKLIEQAREGASEQELLDAVKKSIFSAKTALNINPFFIDLHTIEQAHEYLTTFWKFQLDIFEMKQRFDKENQENPNKGKADTQYLFMFSAPVRGGNFSK